MKAAKVLSIIAVLAILASCASNKGSAGKGKFKSGGGRNDCPAYSDT